MAGGDGSVNEVVNGLLEHGPLDAPLPALAIFPVGSGNDFARYLGIRRGGAGLVRLLAAGEKEPVDAWCLTWPGGRRWFVNVASFGFTAAAAGIIDRRGKRFGTASYLSGALLALARHRDCEVRLRLNGDPWRSVRLGAGVLANAPWFGAGMQVAPGAHPGDGCLDLLTVQGAGRLRLLGLLAAVFTGRHVRSQTVARRLVSRVALDWHGALPFEADGEPVAVTPPVEVTHRASVLRFLRPLPAAR